MELLRIDLTGGVDRRTWEGPPFDDGVPGVIGVEVTGTTVDGQVHVVVQLLLDDDVPGFDRALLDAPLLAEVVDPAGDVVAREPFDHDEFRRRLLAERQAGEATTRGVLVLPGGDLPPPWVRLAFLPGRPEDAAGSTVVVRRSTVAALEEGIEQAYLRGELTDGERLAGLTAIDQRHPRPA